MQNKNTLSPIVTFLLILKESRKHSQEFNLSVEIRCVVVSTFMRIPIIHEFHQIKVNPAIKNNFTLIG